MLQTFFRKIKHIVQDKQLRKRLLFILFILALFRVMAAIPIPGVDQAQLAQFLSNNEVFGVLNIFSGGGLSNLSIVMLGVGPYITAAIIMQILTVVIPRLKELYTEEGEAGRKKFNQYSRYLTVPLAIIQGLGLMLLLEQQGVIASFSLFDKIVNLSVVVGGAIFLMWLGELISEFGIGNGVSVLIFSGIIASVPSQISQLVFSYDPTQLPTYVAFVIAAVLIIGGIVYVNEAERPIPIAYAKQARGGGSANSSISTYLPLKVNQAGVMPIIFALSILLFPQMLANLFAGADSLFLQKISSALTTFTQTTWLYAVLYFVLVFLFTYFYTAITFDPKDLSSNLQKGGAFIPGIRPGESTRQFIATILNRITLVGAVFLGFIAVLPLLMEQITGLSSLAIGGTALLIVVAVLLDLIKKVDAQISMKEY